MGKRKAQKPKKSRPDDFFAAGPFEFARFGKLMMSRDRATPKAWKAAQAKMAANLPTVVAEIGALVDSIAARVARLPADRLLQRAWWESAGMAIGIAGKDPADSDRAAVQRMIDYIQSVIASTTPRAPTSEDLREEEWARLTADVRTLFTRLSFEYQVCRTAALQAGDPNADLELEEFQVRAELLWMNVRGRRYHAHERQALLDVLTPHSDVLVRLFGIDAPALVGELNKILVKLAHGLHDLFTELDRLREDMFDRLQALAQETGETELHILREKLFEHANFAERRERVIGELVGLDLFDVERNTRLPRRLLDELAWSPGEDAEFLAPGPYCGWPLRVWPTMKRPFLRLDGRVLCFDVVTLFDNFYRVLQRAVFRLAPEYRQTWNDRQKSVSEALPFTYLERLLPGAKVYWPVYYRWKTGDGAAQWHEADGLLIYDDHLFVIEVKAGAFTYTSPATDLHAQIASLKGLLLSPASQGSRFVDYLESGADVAIYNAEHKEIGRLRRSDFRHVTVCAVTLDSFTELAARAQQPRKIGIDVGERSVWVLSIDDLRVYVDLFENPLVFLHLVEQRMRAARSDIVDLNDEIDHLTLYILHNNYAQYAAELLGSQKAKLNLTGYRNAIDEYYAAIVREEVPARPEQNIPKRLAEIVSHLSRTTKHGRSRIASSLLDGGSDIRTMIAQTIDKLLRDTAALGRARPMSMHGEYCCTFWVWTPAAPRDPVIALQHTQTVVAAHDESSRLTIELEYSSDGDLLDVHWRDVDLSGLSAGQLERTRAAGAALRQERVARALTQGKIGPNDLCPCGRGRKYKRCCRP